MIESAEYYFQKIKTAFPWILLLLVFWAIQKSNYQVFHTFAELFSVIISGAVFIVAWNARGFIARKSLLLVAFGLGAAAFFDLLHAITYPGVLIISLDPQNITSQFWLAARAIQASCILLAFALWGRSINFRWMAAALASISGLLFLSIFTWKVFPAAYIPGIGQTTFKLAGEISVMIAFLGSIFLLNARRQEVEKGLFSYLLFGLVFCVLAEAAVLNHVTMEDVTAIFAHLFKLTAFFLFYKAMVETWIRQPLETLFHNLKEREEALRLSNRELLRANNRFQSVLRALPVSAMISDPEGRIVEKNPLSDTVWGKEIVSAAISTFPNVYQAWIPVTGEEIRLEKEYVDRALKGEVVSGDVVDVQHKDGDQTTVIVSSAPILGEEGLVLGAVVVAQDITRQRQLEREAREIARETRRWAVETEAIFNALTDAVIVYDQNQVVQRANPQTIALYGFDPLRMERIALARKLVFHTPEGEPLSYEQLPASRAAKGDVVVNERFTVMNPRGRTYIILGSASPIYVGKEITGVVAVWRDVTERERLLHEIQAQRELLQTVFDTEPGGMAIIEKQGLTVQMMNQAFRIVTTHPEKDSAGRPLTDILPSEYGSQMVEQLEEVFASGQAITCERLERRNLDGSTCYFEYHIQPTHWADQEAVLIVLWETTHIELAQRSAEQAAQDAQRRAAEMAALAAELERSNRELEQFAYVASHDLREPLRKIKMFSLRLKEITNGSLDATQVDFLDRMIKASRRMETMIEGLLTYSRVTTKAQPFVPVDLRMVAAEVVSDLEAPIEHTGGSVVIGELPVIEADPLQMRQLLQNLIGNAIKFHRPEAPPLVHVKWVPNEEDVPSEPPQVTIVVEDNGIGFDVTYLERIFKPFERLHGRSEYEGSGMGLAICKKIVDRHGGILTAASVPGEGSRFIITIPAQRKMRRENVDKSSAFRKKQYN